MNDTFTYTINDGTGLTSTATVTIVVSGVNDAPVVQELSLMTTEETTVDFSEDDAKALASDPDAGSMVTFVEFRSIAGTDPTLGTIEDLGGGMFRYDPNGQFNSLAEGATGTDTFEYVVVDDTGLTSIGTVTVTITGVNDAPIAVDDPGNDNGAAFTTTEDDDLTIGVAHPLAIDSDPDDGDTVSIQSVDGTSIMGATVSLVGSMITYETTSVSGFQNLAEGDQIIDSFDYTIRDGQGETAIATITVTITGVNDAPTPVDDSLTTDEDSTVGFTEAGLLDDDTDPDDGDLLSLASVEATMETIGTRRRGERRFPVHGNGFRGCVDDGPGHGHDYRCERCAGRRGRRLVGREHGATDDARCACQ